MTRVLVVDDSAFMRHMVSRVLSAQPDLEIVGVAADGIEALEQARRLRPDVVTLDVEMPRMDGLRTLAALMRERPLPVVMLSTLTEAGAPATIRALELGAVDFVAKPAPPVITLRMVEERLVEAVRHAARARPSAECRVRSAEYETIRPFRAPRSTLHTRAERVVAIGCSTGGPRALLEVIPHLPANLPAAVLVVQHMPAGFTRSLAERLDQVSALAVKEAETGDLAIAGRVLLAPGGRHMEIDAGGQVVLHDGPAVHGVRPSVDVLFGSLPAVFGRRCVAVVLTGMGSDGADGAARLHAAGARVVVEDASTAVVYGMPRSVADRGIADRQVSLPQVAPAIVDLVLNAI